MLEEHISNCIFPESLFELPALSVFQSMLISSCCYYFLKSSMGQVLFHLQLLACGGEVEGVLRGKKRPRLEVKTLV